MINTVEKGPIDAVWRLGGQDTTARGDQVVWGHFYASPSDVTWGSQDNPDLFVKIWFDVSGRVDVNFFHVSVPDIEVYSDLPSDATYDQRGTTIMADRYIRHEFSWVGGNGNEQPLSLSQIKYWAYQIQDISVDGAVDNLANSHYDMLVIEPTRTDWSSSDRDFDTKGMVERLKNTKASDGIHRKLIIAYIDIGEAEDWRWYWTWSKDWPQGQPLPADWPSYIVTHDPDGWEGNYPVAYWDGNWKDIVIYGQNQDSRPYGDYNSVIDEVIKDGFDGIYLDWVEGFENSDVMTEAQNQGKNPAVEMIHFIQEMRSYAEQRVSNFIIIQQNAAALIEGHTELLSKIDAISQEAIWYDGDAYDDWNATDGYDIPNDSSLVNYYTGYLDQYLAGGIPVFNVEYALNYADDAYNKSYTKGYIPYCTRRSLSALTTTPPQGY
jgi:cysteinyl-tRNA synthetase